MGEDRKSDSSDDGEDIGDRSVVMASSSAMERGSSVIPDSRYGESDLSSAFFLPLSIDE